MKTFLLDRGVWDLCLDASGNLAVATGPYRIAQDVASAIRTFRGELYYDTTTGVPYFEEVLGKRPPASVFKARMVEAALSVPGVASAVCYLSDLPLNRQWGGQVQVTTTEGKTLGVSF